MNTSLVHVCISSHTPLTTPNCGLVANAAALAVTVPANRLASTCGGATAGLTASDGWSILVDLVDVAHSARPSRPQVRRGPPIAPRYGRTAKWARIGPGPVSERICACPKVRSSELLQASRPAHECISPAFADLFPTCLFVQNVGPGTSPIPQATPARPADCTPPRVRGRVRLFGSCLLQGMTLSDPDPHPFELWCPRWSISLVYLFAFPVSLGNNCIVST